MRGGRHPWLALVRRDLLRNLRTGRAFLVLCVFVGAGLVSLVITLPSDLDVLGVVALRSALIFQGLMAVFLGLGWVLLPGISALSVSDEFESNTYESLWLTLISAPGLFFGKMITSIGLYALISVAALPLLVVPVMYLRVDVWVFLLGTAAILLNALFCTVVGMQAGMIFRRNNRALLAAYAGLVLVPLVGALLSVIVLPALLIIVPLFLLGGIAFFEVAPPTPAPEPQRRISSPTELATRRARFPFYLFDPLREHPPIRDDRNPMIVKEMRAGLMNTPTRAIRVFYGLLLFLSLVGVSVAYPMVSPSPLRYAERFAIFVWVESIALLFLVPPVTTGSFARERAEGNMDALRMTLLRPREIIMGKLLGPLYALLPFVGAIVLAGLPAAFVAGKEGGPVLPLLAGHLTLLVSVWFTAALSFRLSVSRLSSAQTLVLSYVLSILGLFIGTLVGLQVLAVLIPRGIGAVPARAAVLLSPWFSYQAAFVQRGFDRDAMAFWVGNLVVYAALGLFLLRSAVKAYSARIQYDS